jgi:hypothetical protein
MIVPHAAKRAQTSAPTRLGRRGFFFKIDRSHVTMLRSSEQRQKSAQFVKYALLVGLRISPTGEICRSRHPTEAKKRHVWGTRQSRR